TTWPLVVLRQRRSPLPSPLKSPVPATTQSTVADPGEPPPVTLVALSSQIPSCPVVSLRHRMSAKPSPLKSRCPTIAQSAGAEPRDPPLLAAAPFISQITTSSPVSGTGPEFLWCHRMSLFTSPLKSCVCTGAQRVATKVLCSANIPSSDCHVATNVSLMTFGSETVQVYTSELYGTGPPQAFPLRTVCKEITPLPGSLLTVQEPPL